MFSEKCPLCGNFLQIGNEYNWPTFVCKKQHYIISFYDNYFSYEQIMFGKYLIHRELRKSILCKNGRNIGKIPIDMNIYNLTDSKIDKLLAMI